MPQENRLGSGDIVRTKDGKIGRTAESDKEIDGLMRVYIMQKYELTGEVAMCNPSELKRIGTIEDCQNGNCDQEG